MIILLPMAGAGSRFVNAGYKEHKPVIPTTYLQTGEKLPMVVCAVKDLPDSDKSKVIFIGRDFHKTDNVDKEILSYFPNSMFIELNYLTEGQASTCLIAEEYINNSQELLIAGCDNGMVYNYDKFIQAKQDADVLVFTYRNDESVLINPSAYGWCKIDDKNNITEVSVKKQISDNPAYDHAVVATFWFKKGEYFVSASKKMIAEDDRVNNEFYVDQVINHCIDLGLKAKVFEIDRYLGWGTPVDYERYEHIIKYWHDFQQKDIFIKGIL